MCRLLSCAKWGCSSRVCRIPLIITHICWFSLPTVFLSAESYSSQRLTCRTRLQLLASLQRCSRNPKLSTGGMSSSRKSSQYTNSNESNPATITLSTTSQVTCIMQQSNLSCYRATTYLHTSRHTWPATAFRWFVVCRACVTGRTGDLKGFGRWITLTCNAFSSIQANILQCPRNTTALQTLLRYSKVIAFHD